MLDKRKEQETETWYAFYQTFNDDNHSHADNAFLSAGFQSVEEIHRANLNWLEDVFRCIGFTPENVAQVKASIPNAEALLEEYEIVRQRKPSIRAQLADAKQIREKEQVQKLIEKVEKAMEAYKDEWSAASNDYLIVDSSFVCAVRDAYKYLTETHRFTPEEVESLLRSSNPLHAVASKWWEHQNDMSDFPLAIADAVKEQREASGKEAKKLKKEAR